MATGKVLNDDQWRALRALATNPDPTAHRPMIEAGTLGFLRREGLVGKRVEPVLATRFCKASQKTLSPLTDKGQQALNREGVIL